MYGNEVDTFGRPVEPFSMTAHDPSAVVANEHGTIAGTITVANNIKPETEAQILAEYEQVRADIEKHYPDVKDIPNVNASMGRAAIEAARDEAKKIQMAEEAKLLQKKLAGVGGALLGLGAVASGVELLGENRDNSRLASVVEDSKYAEIRNIFEKNSGGISSAGKGLFFFFFNPLTESRAELGGLTLSAELPNMPPPKLVESTMSMPRRV